MNAPSPDPKRPNRTRLRDPLAETVPADGLSMRALLVEGSTTDRRRVSALLRELGCACDAPDPSTGAGVAVDARYDFLFLDLGLPWLDGVNTTQAIRERLGPDSPFVVGVGDRAHLEACEGPGGIDYELTRPVAKRDLRAVLGV